MIYRGIPLTACLWALLLAGASACFTDPINREPRAAIQVLSTGPYYRGDTVSFLAQKSDDPDGDRLSVSWLARACNADHTDCGTSLQVRPQLPLSEEYQVDIPSTFDEGAATQAMLVIAEVADPSGATHEARMYVDVFNQTPTLELQRQGYASVQGTYPIGSTVRIVAQASDREADQLSYDWKYTSPLGSSDESVGWQAVEDHIYDLRGDVIGQWDIEVTVTDALGASETATISFTLDDDIPPCIAVTDPPAVPGAPYIVERDGPPRRFSVLAVSDDLDIYPPPDDDAPGSIPSARGTAQFRWYTATPYTDNPDGSPAMQLVTGHEVSSYVLDPSAYAPGDALSVRVEIDDRVGRNLPCAQDDATCSLSGAPEQCVQRVTWSIEVR